jgi:ribosomal protein S18 acetylase RimI-like enzyme
VEDYIDEDNQEKYNLHIMILIVLEPYRKQGIAKQMMGWIYRQLGTLKEKIEALDLHVLKSNVPAVKFYLKEGFAIEEEIPEYYDIEGIDNTAYYMKKRMNN